MRERMTIAVLAAAMGMLGMPQARAQADRELIEATGGAWMVLPTDGRPGCSIELGGVSIGLGMRAEPSAVCRLTIAQMREVAGWRLEDGVKLIDAKGQVRMQFVEDETTLLSWPDLTSPRYYLIRPIAGFTHLPGPLELGGAWKIGRKGGRPCTVTFNQEVLPGDAGARTLTPSAACGKTGIGTLTHWQREDYHLLLWGPNDLLIRMGPSGAGRYSADSGGWMMSR